MEIVTNDINETFTTVGKSGIILKYGNPNKEIDASGC